MFVLTAQVPEPLTESARDRVEAKLSFFSIPVLQVSTGVPGEAD